MEIKKYFFKPHGDERGKLVALEQWNDIPFEIKRVYYIYGTKQSVRRGKHAHKKVKQMIICVHGKCKILLDDGKEQQIMMLDNPCEGLYIPEVMWREIYDFSPDAVLLVLASEVYSEDDYIRNYNDFLRYIHENNQFLGGE